MVPRWKEFEQLAGQKKQRLESALNIQNYHLECNEIQSWMKEKTKVIESTQSLGNDLAGVMALQRKLTGMERDLEAIQVWRFYMVTDWNRTDCAINNGKLILGYLFHAEVSCHHFCV